MGAVPASSPLSSTTAAETAAGRLGRRTSAPPVPTVLRPESTVQAAHQPELPSFCEDQQLITGYSMNSENYPEKDYDTIRTMTCVILTVCIEFNHAYMKCGSYQVALLCLVHGRFY